MSVSSITELAAGRVYALHNTFELNGRISAYPETARGFAPANCYLLIDDDAAMLLDSGYTIHEGAILEQLDSLLDREMPLSIFPLRLNEFMSVNNVMAIAKRFNVVECFSPVPDVEEWVEFETLRGEERNPTLKTTLLGRGDHSQVILGPNRTVDVLNAPIRLISTRWIYDEASKILFSSDMFSHIWSDIEDRPWQLGDNEDDNVTDFPFVRSYLLNTRYWWIEGANMTPVRQAVNDVFENFDIQTIAPGYGTILCGRSHVERQFAVLDEVLDKLDRKNVPPAYIPRGLMR
ncbi:MAG: flavorubredoxin [Alphaproteobacteria bacterium]|jgi:flavorubredoxin